LNWKPRKGKETPRRITSKKRRKTLERGVSAKRGIKGPRRGEKKADRTGGRGGRATCSETAVGPPSPEKGNNSGKNGRRKGWQIGRTWGLQKKKKEKKKAKQREKKTRRDADAKQGRGSESHKPYLNGPYCEKEQRV